MTLVPEGTAGHAGDCSLDEVALISDQLRSSGKRVVQCHGTFDLLHLGHVRHLEAASLLGDCLIVTVTADTFRKQGPGRPVFDSEARAEMLASLQFVDWVVINDAADAVNAIRGCCQRLRQGPGLRAPGR